MTLTVEVTPDGTFTTLVQDALRMICPCQSVAVNPATGAVSISAMACLCYCDHRAGCNMLADLVNDSRPILIEYSSGSSGYKDNEVWWATHDVDFGDRDVCGNTLIPAWLQLAHELVHARLNSTINNEDEAVRGENQVRLERCIPMREQYKNETVPEFREGVLDDSNRPEYGCDCSFFRGGLSRMLGRWWCMLHSMYCFPRPIIRIRTANPQGGSR